MSLPPVRMDRLALILAVIELGLGTGAHVIPDRLDTPLYLSLVPAFRLFSTVMVTGGILLLLDLRHLFPLRLRRILALIPAGGLAWLGVHFATSDNWPLAIPALVFSLSAALAPWSRPAAAGRRHPDGAIAVMGIAMAAMGSMMTAFPGTYSGVMYDPIRPWFPWLGLIGLVAGLAVLAPEQGVWASTERMSRWLPSVAFVGCLVLGLLFSEFWSGVIAGVTWSILLLTLKGWTRGAAAEQRAGAGPREGALQDWHLETLSWLLVLMVVLLAAAGNGAVHSPALAHLFVLVIVVYNVLVQWTVAPLLQPGPRSHLHATFYTLSLGILLADSGYLGHSLSVLLILIPLSLAHIAGTDSGRLAAALSAAVVVASEAARWATGSEPLEHAIAMGTVKLAVLLIVSLVGLRYVRQMNEVTAALSATEADLQRQLWQAAMVNRIAHAAHQSLDLEAVLSAAVTQMGQALAASHCFIRLRGEDGAYGVVHQYASPGTAPRSPHQVTLMPAVHLALRRRGVVVVPDVAAALAAGGDDAEHYRALLDLGSHSLLAAPLRVGGECLGVIGFHHGDGPRQWRPEEISFIEAVSGQVSLALSHARAHQDLQRREQMLRESETLFRSAFEHSPIGLALVEAGGRWIRLSPSLCDMLGYTESELARTPLSAVIEPGDHARLAAVMRRGGPASFHAEVQMRHKDGREIWAHVRGSQVGAEPNQPVYYVAHIQDVTERRQFEARLAHAANHDALTDLLNRRGFWLELEQRLAEAQGPETGGALLFLDLDQFKYVNDSLGHQAGDELLASLANLLRSLVGDAGKLARLGGDEFAVIMPGACTEQATTLAERVREATSRHSVTLMGHAVSTTVSIGIARYPEHGRTAEELLARVDMAMYQAKEHGRNRWHLYEPKVTGHAWTDFKLGWEQKIRSALDEGRFALYAQPILDLKAARVTRHELLLRMIDRDGTVISPASFLGVAEQFGLITAIDRWVVRQAIRLIQQHSDSTAPCLEVNLSARALTDQVLLREIQRELADSRIDPASLVFEITETAAVSSVSHAARFIQTLKEMGCRFALDDFGAGFSSFSHLKNLPVDYLKIDGSFVRNLAVDPRDQHMVRAIVEMARSLGKQTIAEFVKDQATCTLLRQYGVDYAQGYHIGRPAPLPLGSAAAWP